MKCQWGTEMRRDINKPGQWEGNQRLRWGGIQVDGQRDTCKNSCHSKSCWKCRWDWTRGFAWRASLKGHCIYSTDAAAQRASPWGCSWKRGQLRRGQSQIARKMSLNCSRSVLRSLTLQGHHALSHQQWARCGVADGLVTQGRNRVNIRTTKFHPLDAGLKSGFPLWALRWWKQKLLLVTKAGAPASHSWTQTVQMEGSLRTWIV